MTRGARRQRRTPEIHNLYLCWATAPAAHDGYEREKEVMEMADRRAGKKQGPYVPSPGGGKQPRARNDDGTWRAKRSDSGKARDTGKKK